LIEETITHPNTNFDENTTEIDIDNIETTGDTNTNLKRPTSLTTASSNPPSPMYNSNQENNTSFKPPKKVLIVEDKTDVNLPSSTENRSRSNSINRFSNHLDSHLELIKHLFDDKTKFKRYFDQFMHIIENIHEQDNPLNIIHEYGLEGSEIISILKITRPYLTTKIAKNNYTHIANKLFKALDIETITEPTYSGSNEN